MEQVRQTRPSAGVRKNLKGLRVLGLSLARAHANAHMEKTGNHRGASRTLQERRLVRIHTKAMGPQVPSQTVQARSRIKLDPHQDLGFGPIKNIQGALTLKASLGLGQTK